MIKHYLKAVRRFWSRVKITNSCWNWEGTKTLGYGYLWVKDKNILAHRFSYMLFVGNIPKTLEIDHLCKNTSCVNPAHLDLVTHKENQYRGTNVGIKNKLKTHCIHGHEFDIHNTHIRKSGDRECLKCHSLQERQRRGKIKNLGVI